MLRTMLSRDHLVTTDGGSTAIPNTAITWESVIMGKPKRKAVQVQGYSSSYPSLYLPRHGQGALCYYYLLADKNALSQNAAAAKAPDISNL